MSTAAPDASEIPVQPLSPKLRAVVEALQADIETMTVRVLQLIESTIPDYTMSIDPALPAELRSGIELHARIWYESLLDAQLPSEAKLEPAATMVRNRVHQGVSLPSLLRAFRVGSRGFWLTLIEAAGDDRELHDELLFKVSPYQMYHFDVVAQAIAMAYTSEQMHHERGRERLRHELWSVISARPGDNVAFRSHCEALGIDPWAPHCALVLRPSRQAASFARLDDAVDRIVAALARLIEADRERLMRAMYRDHLVIWVPMRHTETPVDADRRLAAQCVELLSSLSTAEAAAIGLCGTGSRGWRVSMQQGFRALESCSGGAEPKRGVCVRRYAEILLDDAGGSSDNVRRYLDAMIERLAVEPNLVETLETYLQRRQHRKAAASDLGVHPNTLDHRLERIETLLGGRFDDVAWLAMLQTALRLRKHGVMPDPEAY